MLPPVDEIVANFELLDDWEERYRYLIELGRMLPTLPPEAHSDANKVQGCASQVWLDRRIEPAAPAPILHWRGDSDAHIVRGLIALLLALSRASPRLRCSQSTPWAYFGASACPSTSRPSGRTAYARWSSASAATPAWRCY